MTWSEAEGEWEDDACCPLWSLEIIAIRVLRHNLNHKATAFLKIRKKFFLKFLAALGLHCCVGFL